MSDVSNRGTQYERNPTFEYPKDYVQFLDAQKSLDVLNTSGSINAPVSDQRSFAIKRGFIKNIQRASLDTEPVFSTCYFQFNPQEIRQSVQMREDIYNPIALTPEQLAQPIGGNVNFQFDLLFDRSHELSRRPGGSGLRASEGPNDTSNDPNGRGPDQIGVYADLKVLYNIIGQGLSDGSISLQLEMLKGTYNAKIARENAYTPRTEDSTDTETPATPDDTGDPFTNDFTDRQVLENFFSSNIGNSAFLMPNPVRIVFSPLLMVDGFVTATNVDFLKFTSEMVPMQCRVAMSVNALYIGFNKNSTFLTKTIDTAINVLREERDTDTKSVTTVVNTLLKISPFSISFGDWSARVDQNTWNEAQNGAANNGLHRLLTSGSGGSRVIYLGFPAIRPSGRGRDDDPILALLEAANVSFSITYNWRYRIFGKNNQAQNNGIGYTESEARAIALNIQLSPTIPVDGVSKESLTELAGKLVGDYSGSTTANSKDTWGAGTTGDNAGADRARRQRIKEGSAINSASNNLDSSSNAVKNSYYIVKVDFDMVVTSGTVTRTLKQKYDHLAVIQGSAPSGVSPNITSTGAQVTSIEYALEA